MQQARLISDVDRIAGSSSGLSGQLSGWVKLPMNLTDWENKRPDIKVLGFLVVFSPA